MYDGTTRTGYVVAAYVSFDPQPDPDFEALLDAEGFPESYRPGLRRLHAKFPQWQFKTVPTGLKFADAVNIMYTPGYSLIPNSYNDAWKSLDERYYDWYTNQWRPYDGTVDPWVMCDPAYIAYYMDPRNMMSEKDIFQFEALSDQAEVYLEAGVEVILRGSFMGSTRFTYPDPDTGADTKITYAQAFIHASQFSNVSPYHLAARSRIEVVHRDGSASASATGLFSQALAAKSLPVVYDYDGYYNFYNIGASHSTQPLGNIRNGLEYAKFGPDRKPEQTETDDKILIPWSDRYRSIVGGSLAIGRNYVHAVTLIRPMPTIIPYICKNSMWVWPKNAATGTFTWAPFLLRFRRAAECTAPISRPTVSATLSPFCCPSMMKCRNPAPNRPQPATPTIGSKPCLWKAIPSRLPLTRP